jgi:hypothetical protein
MWKNNGRMKWEFREATSSNLMLGSKLGRPSVLSVGICRNDYMLGRSCSGLERLERGNQGDADVKHEPLWSHGTPLCLCGYCDSHCGLNGAGLPSMSILSASLLSWNPYFVLWLGYLVTEADTAVIIHNANHQMRCRR